MRHVAPGDGWIFAAARNGATDFENVEIDVLLPMLQCR